ncbi:GntR family transcriptional regulator [Thioclava sp. FTW29]|uniref:GntR family transcriptional regulator n=1 Tax=Thioclava litoralis TaxID=3076557 RepID=A0ABZ1E238_9RHOB|nr:GntR family transcriptional regulator [Thioclava sp. FTW29]
MPTGIETTILTAIIEGRLPPGSRLSENELAEAFAVSRTKIREALQRLEARHIIASRPRKGWFVNIPDAEEAAQVFAARRCLEYGYLDTAPSFTPEQLAPIRAHIAEERQAIAAGDKAQLTYLMGDFHVRIIAQSGNEALTEIMRDLTARTILISLRYQSSQNALASHDDHVAIHDALCAGRMKDAARLSFEHLEDVEKGLAIDIAPTPLAALRSTLRLDAGDDGNNQPIGILQ